ncbi:hypothetical protein PT974_12336 [Cladobotryum mycophilum]|uniref:PPPDE domain-containing protein n=1 Tax=Cladobotryum mycophilum TaxID=491253 RepID=A0ABR0S7Q5_9HYPO
MGRKVRIVHMPLKPLRWANTKTLILSHWALLIGEKDLLVEIFPAEHKRTARVSNHLHVTRSPDLQRRKATFKFGIFRQADTDTSDEGIIEAATAIVRRNPVYSLVGYNCQSFVNDLAEALAIPNFANGFKKRIRKFALAKAFIYRGDDNAAIEAVNVNEGAEAQLQYLIQEGRDVQSKGAKLEQIDPNTQPEGQVLDETSEFKLLWPTSQRYLLIDNEDDLVLTGIGLVYSTTDSPEFEVAGIPVPDDPDDLTTEESELLQVTEALVGEDE